MSAVTTIEMRLQIELQRRYLSRPGPLPAALQDDMSEYPALLARQRWGVVRAADLVALLQPWSERDADHGERCFKVAGARHVLLPGLVDEPWVQVLFDEGEGKLALWQGRHVARPMLTIIGHPSELTKLAAPRTVAEIEHVLRRASALTFTADWMLASVFGIDQSKLASWFAQLANRNPSAFLALIRRDVANGLYLLADERGRVTPEVRRKVRDLRALFEIMRLVELLRAGAGPGRTTADALITMLAKHSRTAAALQQDDPLGQHLGDGWMFMSTRRAFVRRGDAQLSPQFPLIAYGQGTTPASSPTIVEAIQDPSTFAFYGAALQQAEIVAGTSRTLIRIDDEQPVDFYCGIEQMRLAVIALRAIARKSGHAGALNHANRAIIGRLALHLLRVVDRKAFDAYSDHWSTSHAVQVAGLTRQDLEQGLTDPDLPHDLGAALVIKTERIRRFVPVAPDSAFNPFWWSRKPSSETWAGYHKVARGDAEIARDDGKLVRDMLGNVSALGTDLPRLFDTEAAVVAEAVALCGVVGAHHTPLARDPALFATGLNEVRDQKEADGFSPKSAKLAIIPRAGRKIVRLARRQTQAERAKNASK